MHMTMQMAAPAALPAILAHLAAPAILAGLIAALPGFSLAQDGVGLLAASKINCTCRFKGRDFQLGEQACLKSPHGPRLARCTTVLNNTSWSFTDEPCDISSLDGGARGARLAANHVPSLGH